MYMTRPVSRSVWSAPYSDASDLIRNSRKAPEYGALQALRVIVNRLSFCTSLLVIVLFTDSIVAQDRPSSAGKALPAAFKKSTPTSITDLKSMEKHVEALIKKVSPAVVALEIANGNGSGVVISSNGFILTAGHVVSETANLEVRITFPDGKIAHGKTLGVASESDAGLVKITDSGVWPYADLDDLEETRVGDWVLALGHPGGFDAKRSLVTRLGRIIRLESDGLQTDCTISPGDSGGPVFNMRGKIIGIHSFIRTSMSENYHESVTGFADDLERLMKEKTK